MSIKYNYGNSGQSGTINLPLPDGFKERMVLHVIASTTTQSAFNIKDPAGNILLHVNPRINQNVIVLNSYLNNWGPEIRPNRMPVKPQVKYHLHISHETNGYRIYIDGEELCFYKHRIQNSASMFELKEGIFYHISFLFNEPRWAIQNINQPVYIQKFDTYEAFQLCKLNFNHSISWIIMTGIVKKDAIRFDVNFINKSGEIIFHFNPRFNENCIVRNSLIHNQWGAEERCGPLVFKRNERFTVAIVIEIDLYRIYVNGKELFTYEHRTHPIIEKCAIVKDVDIKKIVYQ